MCGFETSANRSTLLFPGDMSDNVSSKRDLAKVLEERSLSAVTTAPHFMQFGKHVAVL